MSVEACISPESKPSRKRRQCVVSPAEAMLSVEDLAAYLGIARRTLERMRAAGTLPKPSVIVGSRSPRWTRQAIQAWIDRKAG